MKPGKQPLTGEAQRGVLVPIGGGKDSAVTLELLRSAGVPLYAYIINPRGATVHTTEVAGLDAAHVMRVKRTLDKNMLELNKQGYLNGHTPFSALVAFSSVIAARIQSSANESTVQGSTVNHQYSKSFKFEEDFRSCNAGSKTDSWCGHCPKCLFVYLILSPFLAREEVRKIFGRDMLEDVALRPVLEQLTGIWRTAYCG